VEEEKTPTTAAEEEDVEAHGSLDRPGQDEREGSLDQPDVEAHGNLDAPDVEAHGNLDRPGLD
jgi:hypothetical protein